MILENGRVIENFGRPYFVAEMNSSHNGNLDVAIKMIDEAVMCGCDAVKFQSWTRDSLYSKNYYEDNPIAGRMVEKFSFSSRELKLLADYSIEKKIDFSSTPYSKEEVDFLIEECNVPFIKIASMDINNYPFLEYIARKNKPMILSTGMADNNEIKKAVKVITNTGNNNLCMLHCVSIYPVDNADVNLNNMISLRKEFEQYAVGYSDHTISEVASICAVANGAAIIEKHFTLDNSKMGWDNQMACEPLEFKRMVTMCKEAFDTLGSYSRNVSEKELEQRKKMRRSIVSTCFLKKGHIITNDDLDAKRPAIGIAPDYQDSIVGKKVTRDIEKDEIIFSTDIM